MSFVLKHHLLQAAAFVTSFAAIAQATPFHYGAAIGAPFNTNSLCSDIHLLDPDIVMNWGPGSDTKRSIDVCGSCTPGFLPTLWGRDFDTKLLRKLENDTIPMAILLENEPNWWGFPPLNADHGSGCNMTAQVAGARYKTHRSIADEKWGAGVVPFYSPSPVTSLYQACAPGQQQGCTFQSQLDWLDEYFQACDCIDEITTINVHEYSCHLDGTQRFVQNVLSHFPGKDVFLGELGCDGPSASDQATYLNAVAQWANSPNSGVRGFIWTGVNDVGAHNSQLVVDGALSPVGTAFQAAMAQYPTRDQ